MEGATNVPSRLQLIRAERGAAAPAQGRNCEALLSVMNGKLQVLIDHVQQLEDRVHDMEQAPASQGIGQDSSAIIDAGGVQVDHAARRVFVGGKEVPLSPTEYRLIHQLAVNSGKVVLHRDLLRRASTHGEVNPGNLKVYIGRLRAKLNNGGKVKSLGAFLEGDDKVLVCTHATFRFAVDAYGVEAFDDRLIAVDEFHHVSANPDNKLGLHLGQFFVRGKTHIVAMTGSYFRGDAEAVLAPQDESKFDTVTYTRDHSGQVSKVKDDIPVILPEKENNFHGVNQKEILTVDRIRVVSITHCCIDSTTLAN